MTSWNDVIVAEYSKEPKLLLQQQFATTTGFPLQANIEYRVTNSSMIRASEQQQQRVHGTTLTWRQKIQYHLVEIPIQIAKDLFLPVGYPDSVESSYFAYQVYDSLQGLCSYLRGVVSTSAVLKAAGVGDAQATAMSAAMTWAMRDGVGMIGGLCFSYYASPLFDANIKVWRLFADVINDVGLTLDMLAPYWGSRWFLLVSSLSTLCKVMCGMSAGATKGSITQHFSSRSGGSNVADLNAKESTQETLVSLIGMILGVALARFLHRLETKSRQDVAFYVSWSVFVLLTILHVIANYAGVKLLKLRTLNRERAICALASALDGLIDAIANECQDQDGKDKEISQLDGSNWILSPEQVSESLYHSFLNIFYPQDGIVLGSKLSYMVRGLSPREFLYYMNEFRDENYLIAIPPKSDRVVVALRVGANDTDAFKAFVHAIIVKRCLSRQALLRRVPMLSNQIVVQKSHTLVSAYFGEDDRKGSSEPRLSLQAFANKGWDVESRVNLGFGHRRIQWYGTKSE